MRHKLEASILCYPVCSLHTELSHVSSRQAATPNCLQKQNSVIQLYFSLYVIQKVMHYFVYLIRIYAASLP
uniref:Uncharacterized protein n=1 Tax=Arundo donax TaxID=35708 RepID=A0A0A9CYC2_ARUDO